MIALFAGATVALHLVSHGEAVPLEKSLAELPKQLGVWRSVEVPVEPRIVTALGVTDYLSRLYSRPGGSPLLLYIGYYKSQRTGESIHSPKNCLPGAGWEPVSAGYFDLTTPEGGKARVNDYIIENGLQRQVVLYWYESHGRIIASEYWGKFYMVEDAIRLNRTDAALIRISTPIRKTGDASSQEAIAFAETILGQSEKLLPQ